VRVDKPGNSSQERAREAIPVNGRVPPRIIAIKKVTVFDEEKRLNYNARNLVKSLMAPFRKTARVKRRTAAISNGETRLRLLTEYRIAKTPNESFQAR